MSDEAVLKEKLKEIKREILRPIIKEVFRVKGIVLTKEDTRWLVRIATEEWVKYLKSLGPRTYKFEKFEGKYKKL